MADYFIEAITPKGPNHTGGGHFGDKNYMDVVFKKGTWQHASLICPRSVHHHVSLNDIAKKF